MTSDEIDKAVAQQTVPWVAKTNDGKTYGFFATNIRYGGDTSVGLSALLDRYKEVESHNVVFCAPLWWDDVERLPR